MFADVLYLENQTTSTREFSHKYWLRSIYPSGCHSPITYFQTFSTDSSNLLWRLITIACSFVHALFSNIRPYCSELFYLTKELVIYSLFLSDPTPRNLFLNYHDLSVPCNVQKIWFIQDRIYFLVNGLFLNNPIVEVPQDIFHKKSG